MFLFVFTTLSVQLYGLNFRTKSQFIVTQLLPFLQYRVSV